jgi:hypothetical protein
MAKVARVHTQYHDDKFVLHTLRPGDTLPKGHEKFVRNAKAFAEAGEPEAGEQSAGTGPSKADLVARAKELGIPHSKKNVEQLAADIAAAEAEKAKENEGDAGVPDDLGEATREQLEAVAGEIGGIEFDENTSDDELVALIENAKG